MSKRAVGLVPSAAALLTTAERGQLNAERLARARQRQTHTEPHNNVSSTADATVCSHPLAEVTSLLARPPNGSTAVRQLDAEASVASKRLRETDGNSAASARVPPGVVSRDNEEMPVVGESASADAMRDSKRHSSDNVRIVNGAVDSEAVVTVASSWTCVLCTLQQSVEDAATSSTAACMACGTPRVFHRDRLTILTWNVAMCEASRTAPASWRGSHGLFGARQGSMPFGSDGGGSEANDRAAQALVDAITSFDADVLCLQECPEKWAEVALAKHGYCAMESAPSHCGNVVLLLKEFLTSVADRVQVVGPSVAVRISLPDVPEFTVASSHLAPFAKGAGERAQQLTRLVTAVPTERCILAGDYNMRQAEDSTVERLGGGLTDAWKACGADRDKKFTWDSHNNTFHGLDAFKFTARFDRVYLRGGLCVDSFNLIGNVPVGGREGHYLSDHYGILVNVLLHPIPPRLIPPAADPTTR